MSEDTKVSEQPVAPEKPKENGDKRNPDGTFAPGNPGGPGRPAGSISIISIIKEKLAEVPIGQRRTLAETLAEQILDAAIVEKDGTMQREILHYLDGMPNQKVDLGVNTENVEGLTEFFRGLAAAGKPVKKADKPPVDATENTGGAQ